MRVTAVADVVSAALAKEQARIEREMTSAMRDATGGLKEELRQQVIAAGLGGRLARTWQATVYPKGGTSMEPAGFVFSKAPALIAAFSTGATISPVLMNYLAIPTPNVPRRGRKRMTPRQVEREFGELQIRRGRNGSYLGFVDLIRGRRKGTVRPVTPGRVKQGRAVELTLMFVFVHRAKMPKLLNLRSAADRWGAQVPRLFDARMGKGV